MSEDLRHIVWFSDPESSDGTQLGGKNASLGEMTRNMRDAGSHPEFARFLVQAGIDSISVSPDSFGRVKRTVASAESDDLVSAAEK